MYLTEDFHLEYVKNFQNYTERKQTTHLKTTTTDVSPKKGKKIHRKQSREKMLNIFSHWRNIN